MLHHNYSNAEKASEKYLCVGDYFLNAPVFVLNPIVPTELQLLPPSRCSACTRAGVKYQSHNFWC